MFDTINHKEEIIDYIICRSQVIKQFQMKKQYLTHKQKKLETPTNINSTFQNQKAKSQINRTEGISFSHHRYPEKQQPHSHTHNYYKEPGHQKTVNLLNRLKSVRRIHFQDNEQEKWYDIKMNINEVYNQRKLMEEDINSSSKYIRRNLSKHGKYWQTEESELNDLELRKLLKELRGLNSQMIKIEQQKEELQDQIQRLRRQNERLKAEVVQNKQKVQSLKNQYRISQKFSMQKLFELQEFIQSLEEQNQQLVQEIQKLRKDRNQNQQIIHQQRSEQMQIVSQILTVTIFPTENREMQVLEKQFKDLKLQILSMEKKHLGNINQIKKEYQKEIFTVRNNYFKNLNFYRNLIKKMSTNRIVDSLREPEEILKTDLIEMDQDLEDIDIDDTLQTNTDTYDK